MLKKVLIYLFFATSSDKSFNKTGDICGVMDECLHTDGPPYTYGVRLNSVNLGQTGMTLHCYIPGDTGMTLCWTEQYCTLPTVVTEVEYQDEKSNNILFRNLFQSFTKWVFFLLFHFLNSTPFTVPFLE